VEAKPKLLWVAGTDPPRNVAEAVDGQWQLVPCRRGEPLGEHLHDAALAVVYPNGSAGDAAWLRRLVAELSDSGRTTLFMLPKEGSPPALPANLAGRFLCVDVDADARQLRASFAAAATLRPLAGHIHHQLELDNGGVPKLSVQEVDEQMRLAARLQRDFLPRRLPEVGPARFSVLFRPASWVSGDIYDVIRLDETHVGFYVVDATGHGMPAALMTMFIKRALQTKTIVGNDYRIIPPDVSLRELNVDICEQNLTSCQFCTAVYGVLDTTSLQLTYARAGHPEPLLFAPDGSCRRLAAEGVLLGAYPEAVYQAEQVQLSQGDRLLLYTDGVEEMLRSAQGSGEVQLEKMVRRWARMPRDEMLLRIAARVDAMAETVEAHRKDDVTLVLVDIE